MEQKSKRYVPLHVHSEYSALDALLKIKDLVKQAKSDQAPAVAITDHGGLFGAVEFAVAAAESGIKAIFGMEANISLDNIGSKSKYVQRPYQIVLLAINDIGYRNLSVLSYRGYSSGFVLMPRIDLDLLAQYSDGLVCLSGNIKGLVGRLLLEIGEEKAISMIVKLNAMFPNRFFLEMQRNIISMGTWDSLLEDMFVHEAKALAKQQERINQFYVRVGAEFGIKCVATNDIHYMCAEDCKAHEILLNIKYGEKIYLSQQQTNDRRLNDKRIRAYSQELYYKGHDVMMELFHDIPDAVYNTHIVADMCNFNMDFSKNFYPKFNVPSDFMPNIDDVERSAQYLRYLCKNALENRYTNIIKEKIKTIFPHEDTDQLIERRLNLELGEIALRNFADYILLVSDFVQWAKEKNIPVGPGRGSGGGSMVLFLLGTVDTEPIHLGLFFERFINPERPSFPDLDIDICVRRREEVVNYIDHKYGYVAHICTYGHMKAKMALRDVARTMGIPVSVVNNVIKCMPERIDVTLKEALQEGEVFKKLYKQDETVTMLVDTASLLEGVVRNVGIHAAGIIVSDTPLYLELPLLTSKDTSIPITQYTMRYVEKLGFLKIDVLGLKTLTIIDDAERIILAEGNSIVNILESVDDYDTYKLLREGRTMSIFQLESSGMTAVLCDLGIDKFEELIAAISLYRPGPMNMIRSFINRKHNREPIDFYFPELEMLLKETYGVIVYQEQVMKISQIIGGYSLGEGDILRRAIGKRDVRIMASQKEIFCQRAINKGFDAEKVRNLFDVISEFAGYGFNKAHAAGYAYISYKCAYLKAHYPAVWFACVMTLDFSDLDKISDLVIEARGMQVAVFCPDVNLSLDRFVAKENKIFFPIHAIKGVGEQFSKMIVMERDACGPFVSVEDFTKRMIRRGMSLKVMLNIVAAGGLDAFGGHRADITRFIQSIYTILAAQISDEQNGLIDMFGVECAYVPNNNDTDVVDSLGEKIRWLYHEKELLGINISMHPITLIRKYQGGFTSMNISAFLNDESAERVVCVVIDNIINRVANGKSFVVLVISDENTTCDVVMWNDNLQKMVHPPKMGIAYCRLRKRKNNKGQISITCLKLVPFEDINLENYNTLFTQRQYAYKSDNLDAAKVIKTQWLSADVNSVGLQEIVKLCHMIHPGSYNDIIKVTLKLTNFPDINIIIKKACISTTTESIAKLGFSLHEEIVGRGLM